MRGGQDSPGAASSPRRRRAAQQAVAAQLARQALEARSAAIDRKLAQQQAVRRRENARRRAVNQAATRWAAPRSVYLPGGLIGNRPPKQRPTGDPRLTAARVANAAYRKRYYDLALGRPVGWHLAQQPHTITRAVPEHYETMPEALARLHGGRMTNRQLAEAALRANLARKRVAIAGQATIPTTWGTKFAAGLGKYGGRFVSNLAEAAYGAPGGVYQTGKAIGLDIAETAAHPTHVHGAHTAAMGKALAESTYTTLRHPLRRPGDVALLGFAAASGGASAAAKAGTIGRELAAGNIAEAARVAVRRPPPGELSLPGGVQALQPDNPLLRPLHAWRTRRIIRHVEEGRVTERRGPSPESVVGREHRAREAVMSDVAAAPIIALRNMMKPLKSHEHTAMRLVATEGRHALRNPEDVVRRHVATHERYAQEARDQIAKLEAKDTPNEAALKKAQEEVIYNEEAIQSLRHPGVLNTLKRPRREFIRATAQARRVSRRSQGELQMGDLLTKEGADIAQARIAAEYGNPEALGVKAPYVPKTAEHIKAERRAISLRRRHGRALERARAMERARTPAEAHARLNELDRWYEAQLSDIAEAINPYPNKRAEQSARNMRKARRGGETVNQEIRRMAEARIGAAVEKFPDETVAKLVRERDDLRAALQARQERGTVFAGLSPEVNLGGRAGLGMVKRHPTGGMESATVERLGGALSVAEDTLQRFEKRHAARQPEQTVGEGRAPKGSFYFPTGERFKFGTGKPQQIMTARREGPGGVAPVTTSRYTMGTLRRRTLRGLRRGVVERPGEAIATRATGTARLASAERMQQGLIKLGTKERVSDRQVEIRTGPIDEGTRREIAAELERASTGDETALVRAHDRIQKLLAPAKEGEGSVWVDRRYIKELPLPTGSKLLRGAAKVTAPFRFTGVYAQPKYLVMNLPQNVIMRQMMQAGMRRSELPGTYKALSKQLGDTNASKLLGMAGESRTASYMPHAGRMTRAERWTTEKIMEKTDQTQRLKAVLRRAAEKGYTTEADIRRLLADNADPETINHRVAIARRARKDLVDFAVTPIERELSDVAYFYPWLSRGTAWAGRWVANRPGQAAAAAQLGAVHRETQRRDIGPVPRWMQPYVKTPGGISNLAPLFTPSTPAEIADSLIHPARGESLGAAFGTPPIQAIASPRSEWAREAYSQFGPTSILQNLGLIGKPSKTFPERGFLPAASRFVGGTVAPRAYDPAQVAKQYAKQRRGEMTPMQRAIQGSVRAKYGKEYLDALRTGARNHGVVRPGEDLPADVRAAVRYKTARYANYAHVGAEGQHDRIKADIGQMLRWGWINKKQAAAELAWAATASKDDIKKERRSLGRNFYGSERLTGFEQRIARAAGQ